MQLTLLLNVSVFRITKKKPIKRCQFFPVMFASLSSVIFPPRGKISQSSALISARFIFAKSGRPRGCNRRGRGRFRRIVKFLPQQGCSHIDNSFPSRLREKKRNEKRKNWSALRREHARAFFHRCNLCTSAALCSRLFSFLFFSFQPVPPSALSLFLFFILPRRREILLRYPLRLPASRDIPAHSCVSCHSDLGPPLAPSQWPLGPC